MMLRSMLALGVCLVACDHGDARPVRDAIIGSWDVQCAIHDEHATSCPREPHRWIRQTFRADGTFESRRLDGDAPALIGTWSTDGDQVTEHVAVAAAPIDLRYRARVDGDQLVLWNADRRDGRILRRDSP